MRYRFTREEIGYRRNREGSHVLSIMLDGHMVERAYMYYSKPEAYKKFQTEFGTYPNDYKPAGILTLCNWGGLAIMEIENGFDDYVYVCDNYGDGYKNITKNKIHYTTNGDAYFIRGGRRWRLDQFMRV